MTRDTSVLLLLLLTLVSPTQGQSTSGEAAVRALPQAFCQAWNRHDGHELAQLMADDVDFVTVGAMWLHGRAEFERYHAQLLSIRFRDSTITLLRTAVRFLRPDIAVVHWTWNIAGDRNLDYTPRHPRYGMMTWVAEKRNDRWLVVASQNENAVAWSAAEGQIPNLAMPIPGPDQ